MNKTKQWKTIEEIESNIIRKVQKLVYTYKDKNIAANISVDIRNDKTVCNIETNKKSEVKILDTKKNIELQVLEIFVNLVNES
tara:strand:- start:388 stop:636 length:249 start_codon:yes stop_codon:yes gene_type:complete